jgi:hypothetical protein
MKWEEEEEEEGGVPLALALFLLLSAKKDRPGNRAVNLTIACHMNKKLRIYSYAGKYGSLTDDWKYQQHV